MRKRSFSPRFGGGNPCCQAATGVGGCFGVTPLSTRPRAGKRWGGRVQAVTVVAFTAAGAGGCAQPCCSPPLRHQGGSQARIKGFFWGERGGGSGSGRAGARCTHSPGWGGTPDPQRRCHGCMAGCRRDRGVHPGCHPTGTSLVASRGLPGLSRPLPAAPGAGETRERHFLPFPPTP